MRVPSICVKPGLCYPKFSDFKTDSAKIEKAIMTKDSDNIGTQHIEMLSNLVVKTENNNWLLIVLVSLLSIILLMIILKKLYETLQKNARKQLARELTLSGVNVATSAATA